MKDVPLVGVKAVDDKASGVFGVLFMFEPHIVVTGTMGKVFTLTMPRKSKASELANYLIKVGQSIHEELKKG